MLDGMTDGCFNNNNAKAVCLGCLQGNGTPAGLVYAKLEQLTEGTCNALLLAARPDHRRSGDVGCELITCFSWVVLRHGGGRAGKNMLIALRVGARCSHARQRGRVHWKAVLLQCCFRVHV